MEKRIVSKRNPVLLSGQEMHSDGLRQINVMCVYQDALTHEAAGRAGRAAINGTPVARRSWWNLRDFSQPGVLAGAAYMAMRADVIVVALSCKEGLPLPFYVWANSWLPYRKLPGGTLVLVLGDDADDKWVADHARTYLCQLAAQANMEFVSEGSGSATETETPARIPAHRNRSHTRRNGSRSVLVC